MVGTWADGATINGVALGASARVEGGANNSLALGYSSNIAKGATNSVALGALSKTTVNEGVALGAQSIANRGAIASPEQINVSADPFSYTGQKVSTSLGAVSVGATGKERQITNVAAGTEDTDAVNVGQVKSVKRVVDENAASVASALGGGAIVNADGTVSAPGYTVGDVTVNSVGDAVANLDSRVAVNTNSVEKLNKSIDGIEVRLGNSGIGLVQQDATTKNITVAKEQAGGTVDFRGMSRVNKPDGGAEYLPVTRVLTGLSSGELSAVSTDAVTGAQLFTTNQDVAKLNKAVEKLQQNAGGTGLTGSGNGSGSSQGGMNPTATGENSTATGAGSSSTGGNSTSTGANSIASGNGSTSTGAGSSATAGNSTSTGSGSKASGENSTSTGASATASGNGSTSTGAGSSATAGNSTSTGSGSKASGENSTSTGANSTASGNGSTSTGAGSLATGTNSTANGVNASAVAKDSSAFGGGAAANGVAGTAIGAASAASGERSTALGAGAQAPASNSVALGAGSVANEPNTVSIGSSGYERRITNVADGIGPTDAVNMRQFQEGIGEVARKAYSGVAAASALTMIPDVDQGKTIAVGMGSANYKGYQAVALGLTARVTQNLKVRAGASMASAGTTWGVGVAYQW
ncbi:hypothetical protein BOC49_21355 (plasmid) [Burkholderia pseudomallei]|nr:hypothetical protein BOC49_21355 [Burkholderia pseudomallei]